MHPTIAIAAGVDATSSAAKYARYINQFLCSPPAAFLLHALNKSKELTAIPGLTPGLIHPHLPQSTATDKGHTRHHCANTSSTNNDQFNIMAARVEVNHMSPTQEVCSNKKCFALPPLSTPTLAQCTPTSLEPSLSDPSRI
jgi:hypothetical protein